MANEAKGSAATSSVTVNTEPQVQEAPIHLGENSFSKKDDKYRYTMLDMKGKEVEAPHINDAEYTRLIKEGHPMKNIRVYPKED